MHAPDIEGVVPTELVLQRAGVVADHTRYRADNDSSRGRYVARCWSYRSQTRHGTSQQTEEFWFLRNAPIDQQPRDSGEGRGDIGVDESDRGGRIDFELGAGIEAVPTEPKQTRAECDQRNAVRPSIRDLAFAHVENRSERGNSRDV